MAELKKLWGSTGSFEEDEIFIFRIPFEAFSELNIEQRPLRWMKYSVSQNFALIIQLYYEWNNLDKDLFLKSSVRSQKSFLMF